MVGIVHLARDALGPSNQSVADSPVPRGHPPQAEPSQLRPALPQAVPSSALVGQSVVVPTADGGPTPGGSTLALIVVVSVLLLGLALAMAALVIALHVTGLDRITG